MTFDQPRVCGNCDMFEYEVEAEIEQFPVYNLLRSNEESKFIETQLGFQKLITKYQMFQHQYGRDGNWRLPYTPHQQLQMYRHGMFSSVMGCRPLNISVKLLLES